MAKKKAAPTTTTLNGKTVTAPSSFGFPVSAPAKAPAPTTPATPAAPSVPMTTIPVAGGIQVPTSSITAPESTQTSQTSSAAGAGVAAMGGGLSDQLVVLYPELKAARDFFLAQNYTAAENALKQTNFYKDTSQAARDNLRLKLEQPGVYKQDLANYITNVKRYATQSGFSIDDKTISSIAEKAFNLGYNANSQEARNLFDVNFTLDKIKGGNALLALTAIKNAALANGFNDAQYQSNLPGYLERLKNGEDPQAIQQEIRNTASLGYAEPIKKLMQSGTDLSSIVRPYKDIMYSTLEINPDTIQLSDPRLTQALSGEKEMTLSDFQRSLRKDPTWQYTNNARQEAASVATRVLRDFGFQG